MIICMMHPRSSPKNLRSYRNLKAYLHDMIGRIRFLFWRMKITAIPLRLAMENFAMQFRFHTQDKNRI